MLNSNGSNHNQEPPHIALIPASGMGHLVPFLRLSSVLSSRGCTITLITATPTISAAESTHINTFLSAHPQIHHLEFRIPNEEPPSGPATGDPFFLQWEAITRSGHVLEPLVSSCLVPITAIFSDLVAGVCVVPIADKLQIPLYFVFTTSARFVSLMSSLPCFMSENSAHFNILDDKIMIPGLLPFPKSIIPPPFFNPNTPFTKILISNIRLLSKAKGMLINTFDYFESETITAMENSSILSNIPPIFPIGPLKDYKFEKGNYPTWLDEQKEQSVVYVSFGSRTAMSRDQIRELGDGLETSGYPFLWILKTTKVDRDDEGELRDLLGEKFFEKIENRGIVVKGWAEQEEILAHPSIGGFISHCGWNSVTESIRYGIRILAWPLHGDQRVNAEVVEKTGLGIWEKGWGWGGERLIKGEEISENIKEMMSNEKLKIRAKEIGKEAKEVFEVNGSSEKALMSLIGMVKQTGAV